jgi:hypothetical protein
MLGKFVQLRLQGVRDPFISMANGKQNPPPAPDYTAAANATAAGNIEAARAAAAANRVNQVTPYGNLTYSQTPSTSLDTKAFDQAQKDYQEALKAYNKPSANIGQLSLGNISQAGKTKAKGAAPVAPNQVDFMVTNPDTGWTATQTLTPEQQKILAQQNELNLGLVTTANRGLDYANDVLSKPGVDLSKLPQVASSAGTPSTAMMSSINTEGLPSYGINPGETYTDAIMRRLNPQMEQQSAAEEARLANQGIGLGSSAYKTAKDIFNQKQNDLLTSAQIQGMQTGLQANQQQFGQNATQAQLANQVNQQQFGQGLSNAQLQNAAQQQGFQQQAYNQMQPINVINALRTGSQVQNPSYANVPQQATTAGADILGATNAGYNAQIAATNAQNAAGGNFMSGLTTLGGAGIAKYSDENLKTDIKRIGTHDSGVGIYSYNYKDGYNLPTGIQVGVLAQEVEKVIPEAVIVTDSGFKAVNYAML